ncbi:MAG: glycosyltransferase [Parcubacteria group bacterium]|nr:glycosyltransferase [Parcubacteria group bacterium]
MTHKRDGPSDPPYSVVITTHGRANRAAIIPLVLRALLEQTVSRELYEIVIINDVAGARGPLPTQSAIEDFIVKHQTTNIFYHEFMLGSENATRNAGIKRARGEIIFFCDDDCIVSPTWIAHHINIYKKRPDIVGVGGWAITPPNLVSENSVARYIETKFFVYRTRDTLEYVSSSYFFSQAGNTANMSYRKSILEELGGFDEKQNFDGYSGACDWELKKRIANRGLTLCYTPLFSFHLGTCRTFKSLLRLGVARGKGTHFIEEKSYDLRRTSYGLPTWHTILRRAVSMGKNFSSPLIAVCYLVEMLGRWSGWHSRKKSLPAPAPTRGIDLYIYPGFKTINPYWQLLGTAIYEESRSTQVFFKDIFNLSSRCLQHTPGRQKVIHLQWMPEYYPLRSPQRNPFDTLRYYKQYFLSNLKYGRVILNFLLIVYMKKRVGAKVIWTVHNTGEMNLRPTWTRWLGRWATNLSDAYIFHCADSRPGVLKDKVNKPSFVVPHANFARVYGPPLQNRREARAFFGVPELSQTTIFLILGAMREAKNLQWLLPQLKKLPEKSTMIFLAGEPVKREDWATLNRYRNDPRFTVMPERIPDTTMRWLLAAADFLIVTQTRGFTSGATMTALSYGLPVLNINWGCSLRIIQHGVNGFLFNEKSLSSVLTQAIATKNDPEKYEAMRQAASASVKHLTWDAIARQTVATYQKMRGENQ